MNLLIKLIKLSRVILILSITSLTHAEQEASGLWTPPGRLISVGTHRLHIYCLGEKAGKPTVIIDSGLGGFSLEWRRIQRYLSTKYQVCSYDRAGYGWSDPGPFPRTTKTIVAELNSLLEGADVSPPYLLIGHSFGGYNMMYYANLFPTDVVGLVLIDSSHPDQANWFPSVYPDLAHARRRTRFVSTPKLPVNYPDDYKNTAYHLMSAKKARNALRFESMNFEISGDQVRKLERFPSIPLVVLTRGERAWPKTQEGEELETVWMRLQNELARLSENSTHVVADFSGHYIHLDQPFLVEEAIRGIVDKAPCVREQRVIYAELEIQQEVVAVGSDVGDC